MKRSRLLNAVCAIFLLGIAPVVALAVPHAITPVVHPFDPDWPAVFLIISNKCAGCHRPKSDLADYTTYQSLMAASSDDEPLVRPGDADASLLFQSVAWNVREDDCSGLPKEPEMPPDDKEWLTVGQLETIHRWIENGARQYQHPDVCKSRPLMEIDFPSAKQCGACHPKQYDQWSRSMHAYAQHSPVFEAFNLTLQERTGGTLGTFCTRCHTQLGTALGENGVRRNVHRSRLAMEGVTCVTCHRRKFRHYKSNSRVHVEPGALMDTCVFGPFDDAVSTPSGTHPSKGLPYIKSSQFCGECHDVTMPNGVRLEEAFSEWQNSPAAKNEITCQHCHMGPVQGLPIPIDHRPLGRAAAVPGMPPESVPLRRLTDHTFAGPDYSMLPDTEFPHKLDWMYETDYRNFKNLTSYQQKTLNELRRMNRRQLKIAAAKRYELLSHAAELLVQHPRAAKAGGHIDIQARVKSKIAGHNFPTGFTSERQVWVAVELYDPQGNLVFSSGDLDRNADLRDDHSHGVLAGKIPPDVHLLNFQSKFIVLANKGTERSVVLSVNRNLQPLNVLRPASSIAASFGRPQTLRVSKGSIPPLKSIGETYPIRIRHGRGEYELRVRLNFRNLPPTLLDHIGVPHLKKQLEVVTIDEYTAVIHVD